MTSKPITADTITDEQIRELLNSQPPGEHEVVQLCLIALGASTRYRHRIDEARTCVAELFNARKVKS